MKRIFIIFGIVLLSTICSQSSVAAENSQADNLENKNLIVRIYSDWRTEAVPIPNVFVLSGREEKYKTIKVQINNRSFSIEPLQILQTEPGTEVVILVHPSDQTDSDVKNLLNDTIFVLPYRNSKAFQIPEFTPDKNNVCTICDTEGNPLVNSRIEIYISDNFDPSKAWIGTDYTNENGQLNYPKVSGPVKSFYLFIRDPNYGIFFVDIGSSEKNLKIFLPAVKQGSKLFERSIWGTVSAQDGQPVSGAAISCSYAISPAGARIAPAKNSYRCMVLTDEQGKFCMNMAMNNNESGLQIPALSNYYIAVRPPEAIGLSLFQGLVQNGRESKITVESSGILRKFAFEDDKGPITDIKILEGLKIHIESIDEKVVILPYNFWKNGRITPVGKYYVEVPALTRLKFEPVDVNEQDLVTFKSRNKTDKQYTAQIVDGVSLKPMPGVFVLFTEQFYFDISSISSQQWDLLQNIPVNPLSGDKTLEPLKKISGFINAARTDKDGIFQLTVTPDKTNLVFDQFIVFQRDYMPLLIRMPQRATLATTGKIVFDGDANDIIKFDTMPLFPCAYVTFESYSEIKDTEVAASQFYVEPPGWFIDFQRKGTRLGKPMIRFAQLPKSLPDSRHRLIIPAGVNVQLRLDLNPRIGPPRPVGTPVFTDIINCPQGRTVDIGKMFFGQEIGVYVKVIDSAQKPLEGVEVRLGNEGGWIRLGQSAITDVNGIAKIKVPLNYQSNFMVGRSDPVRKTKWLRQSLPYLSKGAEDANSTITFQLNDEVVRDLFDPNPANLQDKSRGVIPY